MELNKTEISLYETIVKGTTQAMADGEAIVPDTKPDILKILQVDADACITDRYIENGRLYLCGRVDYKVLYIPDSNGERIKSILTSMEFRQAADSGGAEPDDGIFAYAAIERVEFNAVNSRKIRLRAIVHIDYEVCRAAETEICVGVDNSDAECRFEYVEFENAVNLSNHEFTVKESVEVPSGQSSVAEILKTDVRIFDTEYKTVTGKVIVKGNIAICVLYTDDESDIKFIESELPFTEVLDADGVGEETVCDIDYSVVNVMCDAEPDSDGDMRIISVDADICASLRGTETKTEEVLCDCFIPYEQTSCETEKLSVFSTVYRPCAQSTIREIIEISKNVPGVSGVYNVVTQAEITKTQLNGSRLLCEGRIEAYVLYLTDSAESPIYSIKKDIPFSFMIECEGVAGDEEIRLKASVNHSGYSLNPTSGIELRCLVLLEGKLLKEKEFLNITSVSSSKSPERRGIFIYFVKDGDEVWDVAKRYAVPCEKIIKYNNIDDSLIAAGTKLFIPA